MNIVERFLHALEKSFTYLEQNQNAVLIRPMQRDISLGSYTGKYTQDTWKTFVRPTRIGIYQMENYRGAYHWYEFTKESIEKLLEQTMNSKNKEKKVDKLLHTLEEKVTPKRFLNLLACLGQTMLSYHGDMYTIKQIHEQTLYYVQQVEPLKHQLKEEERKMKRLQEQLTFSEQHITRLRQQLQQIKMKR